MRRTTALIPLALAALVAGGCGGGADQTALVRATVVDYGKAVATKDYRTICNHLFSPTLLQPASSIDLPCTTALSRAFKGVVKPKLTILSVKVTGQSALVSVHTTAANQAPDDTTIGLVKVGSSWRIGSLAQPAG